MRKRTKKIVSTFIALMMVLSCLQAIGLTAMANGQGNPPEQQTGPAIDNVKVSANNKNIFINFKQKIGHALAGKTQNARNDALKAVLTINTDAENNPAAFVALNTLDKVNLSANRIHINLNTALNSTSVQIKIPADSIKDSKGVNNTELVTPTFKADKEAPEVVSASLDAYNKVITLTLNEAATNIATASTRTLRSATSGLKNAITIDRDGGVAEFVALDALDQADHRNNVVRVFLSTPLSGDENFVKINSGALSDVATNTGDITSPAIEADEEGPKIASVKLSDTNKVITLTFDENFTAVEPLVSRLSTAATVLKDDFQLYRDDESPAYEPLGEGDSIKVGSNTISITLAVALKNGGNKVKLAAGKIQDVLLQKNEELESPNIVADDTAPTVSNIRVTGNGKTITITFNEKIFNASTALTGTERRTQFVSAVTLTADSSAGTPVYDRSNIRNVTIASNKIVITTRTSITGSKNQVKIAASALKDRAENIAGEITTADFSR